MVSGSGWGGDCPPSHSGGQCSGESQLSDRVQHSLKRSLESEEMPGLLSTILLAVSSALSTPAAPVAAAAPAALGVPPPDDSFSPSCPTRGVEESVSSALNSHPDLGMDRRLGYSSLTVKRDRKERFLRSLSRPSVESQASSFNMSGMLNQTGQVGRHTLPSSLPFPSRTSVPNSICFVLSFPLR